MREINKLVSEIKNKNSKVRFDSLKGGQGESAPHITSISLTPSNSLIFILSNGKKFNAGKIPLPRETVDGLDGNGVDDIDVVDNEIVFIMDDGSEIVAGELPVPKDGVGIKDIKIVNDKLSFTLTNSKKIDTFALPKPKNGEDGENGVGIKDVKVNNNQLTVHLSNGKKINAGTLPVPKNGNDGVSIKNIRINPYNTLIADFTDGSIINIGKMPSPKDGVGVKDITVIDGNIVSILTDGSKIRVGKLPVAIEGKDAPVIKEISIDDGELIFKMSDGRSINAGELPKKEIIRQVGGGSAPGVTNSSASEDGNIVIFTSTSGRVIRDSGVNINEDGDITLSGDLITSGGRIIVPSTETAVAYSMVATEYRKVFNVTADRICTLLDPTANSGLEQEILNKYSSTANVTFSRAVDGDSALTLPPYGRLTIWSDGTGWLKVR